MIYMITGSLPWSNDVQRFSHSDNAKGGNAETAIRGKKIWYNDHLNHLCAPVRLEIKHYFQNIQSLGVNDKPNYGELREILYPRL